MSKPPSKRKTARASLSKVCRTLGLRYVRTKQRWKTNQPTPTESRDA